MLAQHAPVQRFNRSRGLGYIALQEFRERALTYEADAGTVRLVVHLEASAQRAFTLLDHEHCWVKVSGVDRCSRQGPPYADAVLLARTLVEDHGDRVLWGTDWPHPNHTHVPDDGLLVDILAQIAPGDTARRALLVDNPQRLYQFPVALTAIGDDEKA